MIGSLPVYKSYTTQDTNYKAWELPQVKMMSSYNTETFIKFQNIDENFGKCLFAEKSQIGCQKLPRELQKIFEKNKKIMKNITLETVF